MPIVFFVSIMQCLGDDDLRNIENEILDEGLLMYNLEVSSWIVTDLLNVQFNVNDIPDFRGYITYQRDNYIVSTLWQEAGGKPTIFETFIFDTSDQHNMIDFNASDRNPNAYELYLYTIRSKVYQEMITDTIFKIPDDAKLNFVFVPDKSGNTKIYLLTGLLNTGYIPLGNDYLMWFDKNAVLLSLEKLHRTYLPVKMPEKPDDDYSYTFHSHLSPTPDFITPSDICTILLYVPQKFNYTHVVLSKDYVSVFTVDNRKLKIYTQDEWAKIAK